MTDERYVYTSDVRDRKRTASGSRAKKGGSRSRRCPLPSDTLTKAQRQKIERFCRIHQAQYADGLRSAQGVDAAVAVPLPRPSGVRLQGQARGSVLDARYLERHILQAPAEASWEADFQRSSEKARARMGSVYGCWVSGRNHPPNFAHSAAGGRDSAGAVLGGVHAFRALWKRHGALYGLTRARRAAPPD